MPLLQMCCHMALSRQRAHAAGGERSAGSTSTCTSVTSATLSSCQRSSRASSQMQVSTAEPSWTITLTEGTQRWHLLAVSSCLFSGLPGASSQSQLRGLSIEASMVMLAGFLHHRRASFMLMYCTLAICGDHVENGHPGRLATQPL